MKLYKVVSLSMVLGALIVLLIFSCVMGATGSNSTNQTVSTSSLLTVEFTYVAEARYNGFGVIKLVTIGPSKALYILSSNGTVTPYYDANGRHMTVASLEQNLE